MWSPPALKQQEQEHKHEYHPSAVLWLILVPAIGGFLFGYDIGGTSFVVAQLESLSPSSSSLSLQDSPLKTGWIVSSRSAGALLGSAFLMYIDNNVNVNVKSLVLTQHRDHRHKQQQQNDRHKQDNYNTTTTTTSGGGNHDKYYQKLRSFLVRKLLAPIGRRTELRYAGILYTVGGLLQFLSAYSHIGNGNNTGLWPFFLLSLGRWIYGAGIGFAVHGGITYLAEITPPAIRGMVVSGGELAIVMGVLLGYIAGRKWTTTEHNNGDTNTNAHYDCDDWAYIYAATLVASIAMIGFSYTIPESPRYLVSSSYSSYQQHQQQHQHQRQNQQQQQQQINASGSIPPGENHSSSNNSALNNTAKNEIITRIVAAQVLESLRFVWKPKASVHEHRKLMEIFHRQQFQQQQHQSEQDGGSENSSPLLTTTSSTCNQHQHTQHHKTIVAASGTPSLLSLLSDPYFRPALRAGLGLVVLQQITGQPSVLSYATPILARIPGLTANTSVLLALFKLLATSISVVMVETRGRKTLLMIGCSLMLVSLLILTFAFSSSETTTSISLSSSLESNATRTPPSQPDTRGILTLLGMFIYIAGYQIGFGPITWLVMSEVFPQSVRGKAVALAVQTDFALNALVQFLMPIMHSTLGMSKTFAVFGAMAAYSIYFVQECVPETKGLTLEELEDWLGKAQARAKTPKLVEGNGRNEERTQLLAGGTNYV